MKGAVRLLVVPGMALPVVEHGDQTHTLRELESLGVVKLSTMDRMILGDLTRKLQAIAVALENRQ